MSLFRAIERVRSALLDPMDLARRGYPGRVLLELDDLNELFADWLSMDRKLREIHERENGRPTPRKMIEGDL